MRGRVAGSGPVWLWLWRFGGGGGGGVVLVRLLYSASFTALPSPHHPLFSILPTLPLTLVGVFLLSWG